MNIKGLVYLGNNKIELKEIENPKITDNKDVIVKVILSSICTSDFHIINGAVPRAKEKIVLGHEFVGDILASIYFGAELCEIKNDDTEEILFIIVVTQIITTISNIAILVKH